jgi:hypothetical protein
MALNSSPEAVGGTARCGKGSAFGAFLQFGGELDALCLAAGERRGGPAEFQMAQNADDGPVLEVYVQGLPVVLRSVTDLTRHVDVRAARRRAVIAVKYSAPRWRIDAELGVPDEEKSLSEGAVAPGQVIRSGNRASRSGPEASRTTESTQTERDAA